MNEAFERTNDEEGDPSPEPLFEDEILPPAPEIQRSIDTTPFDPFAPAKQQSPSVPQAIPLEAADVEEDSFRDEDEAMVPGGINPSSFAFQKEREAEGPILIPMNPDADVDLLGSIAVKHESKTIKDAKITGITYREDDKETADLLILDSEDIERAKNKDEETAGDRFVDETNNNNNNNNNNEADNAWQGGGLFSRIRSKIASSTKAPEGSETKAYPSSAESLVEGGNSLPHPETVLGGHTRDLLKEESDPEDESVLDENGNSLPHPEEVLRLSLVGAASGAAAAKHKRIGDDPMENADALNLGLNGNSLPHPEEMLRLSGHPPGSNHESSGNDNVDDVDARNLDSNGNSLPHPDTMMVSEERKLLNDILEKTSSGGGSSSGSFEDEFDEGSFSKERLLAEALASESESNLSSDYPLVRKSTREDTSDDGVESRGLRDNGNSLPSPSGVKLPSLRWGSIKRSLSTTFSKNNTNIGLLENDETGANDSEAERFRDEGKTVDPSSDRDLLMEDDFARVFHEEKKKRRSTLQSMKKGMAKVFRPAGDRPSDDLFAEADEENVFSSVDYSERSKGLDEFDDEADNIHKNNKKDQFASLFRKEHLLTLMREHRKNPRSRKKCLALLVFFLFLIILIPSVTRNNKHIQPNTSINPSTEPPTAASANPPVVLGACEDEIVLTDRAGADLEIDALAIPCYSVREPIYFRFNRCRPSSPLDWIGVYQAGSIFMDRLWKPYTDGVYLCGGQPCPVDDPLNNEGDPPLAKYTSAPPIRGPGRYRLFLVKDSYWPYEFIKYTPSFQVVYDKDNCPVWTAPIFPPPPPVDKNVIVIDGELSEATQTPTSWTSSSGTYTTTSWGTTSGSFGGTSTVTSTYTSILIFGDDIPENEEDSVNPDIIDEIQDLLDQEPSEILDQIKDSFGI